MRVFCGLHVDTVFNLKRVKASRLLLVCLKTTGRSSFSPGKTPGSGNPARILLYSSPAVGWESRAAAAGSKIRKATRSRTVTGCLLTLVGNGRSYLPRRACMPFGILSPTLWPGSIGTAWRNSSATWISWRPNVRRVWSSRSRLTSPRLLRQCLRADRKASFYVCWRRRCSSPTSTSGVG